MVKKDLRFRFEYRSLSFRDVLLSIVLMGIAYLMLRYKWTYSQAFVFYFITAILFLVEYRAGTNARYLLVSSSNYISVLLLLSEFIYYISIELDEKSLTLFDCIPALLSFLISIWARGRSGIACCIIFLLFIVAFFARDWIMQNRKLNTLQTRKIFRVIFVFIIVCIIVIICFSRQFSIVEWFMSLGKWNEKRIDNTARMYIWSSYFDKMFQSIKFWFFETPLAQIDIINHFNGNCHNSFIQLHAYNGIVMFLVFFYYLVKAIGFYLKNKQYIMLLVIFVFCLRAFTDKFIFLQYGMPLMIFLVFYPYFKFKVST